MENVGLALPRVHYNVETDLDEIIRRFARLHPKRMELADVQNPRKGNFRAGVKIHKNSWENKNFRNIIFSDNFRRNNTQHYVLPSLKSSTNIKRKEKAKEFIKC